ncbi:unnamed protein product [Toxocara canis]|uniref:Cadherin domain-containing protein n=1 Tax=Toxocara canis TaxID=6265 RepID=A0A183V191_TOXCA|nr:unnamed protein product [Toxocara canis]
MCNQEERQGQLEKINFEKSVNETDGSRKLSTVKVVKPLYQCIIYKASELTVDQDYAQVAVVLVNTSDVNDRNPKFELNSYAFIISSSTAPGMTIAQGMAFDGDRDVQGSLPTRSHSPCDIAKNVARSFSLREEETQELELGGGGQHRNSVVNRLV